MGHRSPQRRPLVRLRPAAFAIAGALLVMPAAGCDDQPGRDSSSAPPSTATSASSSSPTDSPTPSPSPTPTPDPDDVAAKEAVAAYKHYIAVSVRETKKKPTPEPSKEWLSLTTDGESNWLRNDARSRYEKQARIVAGNVSVTAGPVDLTDHAAKAVFEACLDYRTVRSEEHGKPIKTVRWYRNRVQMKKVSGSWLVSQQDGWQGKVSDSCPQEIA